MNNTRHDPSDIDLMPTVMGEDGQFHAVDDEVDLSDTTPEAWVALLFFWALGLTVFYQFFTRYALNNSAAPKKATRITSTTVAMKRPNPAGINR